MLDIRKHLLFFPFEFNLLQYLDGEEFRLEECDTFIVASSSSMIWPSEQSVGLPHGIAWGSGRG